MFALCYSVIPVLSQISKLLVVSDIFAGCPFPYQTSFSFQGLKIMGGS